MADGAVTPRATPRHDPLARRRGGRPRRPARPPAARSLRPRAAGCTPTCVALARGAVRARPLPARPRDFTLTRGRCRSAPAGGLRAPGGRARHVARRASRGRSRSASRRSAWPASSSTAVPSARARSGGRRPALARPPSSPQPTASRRTPGTRRRRAPRRSATLAAPVDRTAPQPTPRPMPPPTLALVDRVSSRPVAASFAVRDVAARGRAVR